MNGWVKLDLSEDGALPADAIVQNKDIFDGALAFKGLFNLEVNWFIQAKFLL